LNGATFTAPGDVTLTATATDADGTIKRLDFFANGNLIASRTTSPFTASWKIVAAGTYTLTAVATDDVGGQKTSNAVAITATRKNQK
jgi:hypothetical protein